MIDWMQQQEHRERFEHEAVQTFADYVELVGLDHALVRVIDQLKRREDEKRRKFDESADFDIF